MIVLTALNTERSEKYLFYGAIDANNNNKMPFRGMHKKRENFRNTQRAKMFSAVNEWIRAYFSIINFY
jgi:hypothetical protein